jgi:hypothetical protein
MAHCLAKVDAASERNQNKNAFDGATLPYNLPNSITAFSQLCKKKSCQEVQKKGKRCNKRSYYIYELKLVDEYVCMGTWAQFIVINFSHYHLKDSKVQICLTLK